MHLLEPQTITRYQKRISGPLLDRIGIHIEVPRVAYEKLSDQRLGEPSSAIRARVEFAREGQRERFAGSGGSHLEGGTNPTCNADMRPAEVRQHCQLDETGRALMRTAMNQLQLSVRAYHRVLKLSCTIADLVGSESIQLAPIFAALGAEVTLLDASPKQLAQDQFVAERDNLNIRLVEGDMADKGGLCDYRLF